MVKIDNRDYELMIDYKSGFDLETLKEKYTEYFSEYDYILGDWAYGKLRLKGFCEKNNRKYNQLNDFKNKDEYLLKECAYDCKYFVIKKVN